MSIVHNQKELSDTLNTGEKNIILDGGKYRIPLNKGGITYEGKNGAVVGFTGKGEIFIEDYGISISNCEFDEDAKSRLIVRIEQEEEKPAPIEPERELTPAEEYHEDKEYYLNKAKENFKNGNIAIANSNLFSLYWHAKSVHDFKTAYNAVEHIRPLNDLDREEKYVYGAEMLCCMGHNIKGVAQFEKIIRSYNKKSIAETAVILLSRYYRRKMNFAKELFWYLYGVKKFGIDGYWDNYKDYDEQWDVVYYGDDDNPYYIDGKQKVM